MSGYLVVLAVSALVCYAATFLNRRIALRVKAVVEPDERRVHQQPTATIGGVSMYVGFLAALGVAYMLPQFNRLFRGSSELLGVLLAATVMFMVGLVDDFREVSAPAKVAGQVLAASVLTFFGVTMFYFKVPFAGVVVLSSSITPLLTAVWVVAMANAINLIDGLDGLASGIVAIAAGSFFIYSNRLVDLGALSSTSIGPLVAVITAGVCIGFLPHNFHPAKIFMGDTGALFLGLLMAASTSVVGGRTTDVSGETFFFFAPLFIPFFILGVPMVDMLFAIIRRTAKRTGVSTPDKQHLHHRLIQMGHGHRRSVLILWAWTAVLSGFVLTPTFTRTGNALVPFVAAALGVSLYTLFHPAIRDRAFSRPRKAWGKEPLWVKIAKVVIRPVKHQLPDAAIEDETLDAYGHHYSRKKVRK
ncbi:MAG: undecaprenyl/decaprenyl-phosphate alpha-N-acetylglucosaminyl 1-phosphate transferase [Acidimicrobiaceae bacterium]|nr:undecaprenyl/decaprenyl-phosphate alpha-N-acetylglucosaminyl 1-phosphate transferase [Acidimicrobiaceae bacterium]